MRISDGISGVTLGDVLESIPGGNSGEINQRMCEALSR